MCAGFQNWILRDTAASQGHRAVIKAWRNYSRVFLTCAYQTETWKLKMFYKFRSTEQDFPFCPSTSIKSKMTSDADFRFEVRLFMERANLQKCSFCFCCVGSTLTCGGEDHADWISGQTRGLSGQQLSAAKLKLCWNVVSIFPLMTAALG